MAKTAFASAANYVTTVVVLEFELGYDEFAFIMNIAVLYMQMKY